MIPSLHATTSRRAAVHRERRTSPIASTSRSRAECTSRLVRDEGRHLLAVERSCGDAATEVACAGVVDGLFAAGSYTVVVEAATPDEIGAYTIRFDARDVATEEAACKKVPHLMAAHPVTGTLDGAPDRFAVSCASGDGASSADRVYSFDLAAPATVHLDLQTPTFAGALALRRRCVDTSFSPKAVEIDCASYGGTGAVSRIVQPLEAGTYYVVVEGHSSSDSGPFTIGYTTSK